MAIGSTVFAQITSRLYPSELARCVSRYPMRRRPRGLSASDHFLALCFAQLTYRESLRDVVACLGARPALHYHLGFRGHLSRTNLAYANTHRDWRLFAAIAQVLMRRAARLYHGSQKARELSEISYALDASIIGLSLKLFPWAAWKRSRRSAVKLHTLLSLRGNIPAWAAITEAGFPEQKMLDEIPVECGAFYIMDRGYLDFTRLVRLHACGAFFVVRSKCHVRFAVVSARPVDKTLGLRCDQTIRLNSSWSRKVFGEPLRRVRARDEQSGKSVVLLTNNFELSAQAISELYRRRWQIELFFKWIKQHLRLRQFLGRSPNAVHCQVWSAICAYLLVAITRKELGIEKTLYQMLQITSVSALEQVPLPELFSTGAPTTSWPIQSSFPFTET